MSPKVETFFDKATSNATHLVYDFEGGHCAVIDPVRDFDPAGGRTGTDAANVVIEAVETLKLTVDWILETHVHADHLTGAPVVRERAGGQTGIGDGVKEVQKIFAPIFGMEDGFPTDGSQFDRLFTDGDTFAIGELEGRVIHTPGHTPACVSYVIGDAVFTGDTFFMPDSGTARCDFPGGSAATLYRSLQKILSLPSDTRMFINHDYGAGGSRDFAWETTVAEQAGKNIHVGGGVSEADFVEMRETRDATLSVPRLILPSIQVNICAGDLPEPESNGTRYLKIPLDVI